MLFLLIMTDANFLLSFQVFFNLKLKFHNVNSCNWSVYLTKNLRNSDLISFLRYIICPRNIWALEDFYFYILFHFSVLPWAMNTVKLSLIWDITSCYVIIHLLFRLFNWNFLNRKNGFFIGIVNLICPDDFVLLNNILWFIFLWAFDCIVWCLFDFTSSVVFIDTQVLWRNKFTKISPNFWEIMIQDVVFLCIFLWTNSHWFFKKIPLF